MFSIKGETLMALETPLTDYEIPALLAYSGAAKHQRVALT